MEQSTRHAVTQATARLQHVAVRAVDTLDTVMDDAKATASSRVSAARTALDLAYRAVELEDVEERVTALERARESSSRDSF